MGVMAFTPVGNTVTFTAAVTAPTAVQAVSSTLGGTQYRIHNTGNVVVYIGYGTTAAAATTMANASINGSTLSMVPNSVEVFTFNGSIFLTGVTTSGTSVVNVTPGDGN